MIDITKVMDDTDEVRKRMWALWDNMGKGKAKGVEVRNQIAVANVILNGHKVDIAAAHFLGSTPVVLSPSKRHSQRAIKHQ